VERKLATVLFVDIVDSTALVSGTDPEVVRRRVNRFFEHVSGCIQAFGGTVEKFAGDAVMAAFGVPVAHEDDAERALRAALAIVASVDQVELQARIGVEAGEVVTEDVASTFATGEAVNMAARLQQQAGPNEILAGPGAYRLAIGRIDFEAGGKVELRGVPRPVPVWRAVGARERGVVVQESRAPFVGRDEELDLLQTTFERAVRHRRAHLFTVFGEPGVGKSRLGREFLAGLEGATVLVGRCLPYGQSVTYWALAEMVKAAAGISDDDPFDEAHDKLIACCEDDAVADLLALAVGVLEAVQGDRSQQEIAWAAREWAEQLASAQPLVLVFEDIHWAEEPLLELVDHLASWVRDVPMLLLCLARNELLDIHASWGGGRVRATAIELEPLPREESEELLDALLGDRGLPEPLRDALLAKTEGNPLYLEETVRMVAEGDGEGGVPIPDTLQALIAARIDRLPASQKTILQRASVIGRAFWRGALEHLSPDVEDLEPCLEELLLREFLLREPRSSIRGEDAFRFKHVLIREVAYAGLPKWNRATHHEAFAEWLGERAGDELLEIRAYHLDQAAALHAELDGAPPRELAAAAAAALTEAGKRALAREANHSARKLLLRAVELEPTLARRHKAALAAWRLSDFPAVSREAEAVLEEAREAGERGMQARAATALAQVALFRDADLTRARELADEALALLDDSEGLARYDALRILSDLSWWTGDLTEAERVSQQVLEIARAERRPDLESTAAKDLAQIYMSRLELDRADPYCAIASDLAEESGSIMARAQAASSRGHLLSLRGDIESAAKELEQARELFEEVGDAWWLARMHNGLGWIAKANGDMESAERHFRSSIRILKPLEERGTLCESQRSLAEVLVALGRVDEAERFALQARETVGAKDLGSQATTREALAVVRAAQGRFDEAEALLREAIDLLDGTDFIGTRAELLGALVAFLRGRGRASEAAEVERQRRDVAPVALVATPEVTPARAATL
jgi:class 3 adenylate cyclase/tetratricopeptide (TPR) repeat protein